MALFPDESRSTKFGVKLMLGIVIGGFGGLVGLIGLGIEPVLGIIIWCLSVIIYKFVVHILFG